MLSQGKPRTAVAGLNESRVWTLDQAHKLIQGRWKKRGQSHMFQAVLDDRNGIPDRLGSACPI